MCSLIGMTDQELEALTERIIGCAIEVHRVLGPGLLESVYDDCLVIELQAAGLRVERQRRVEVDYKGSLIYADLRIDLIVENTIVIELKAVEAMLPVFIAQVITYLKVGKYPAGLIINFNVNLLRNGIRRVDHPDRYVRKPRPLVRIQQEKEN